MKKYFFVLLLLSFIFYCKKKELTFTLKGSVTDNTFGAALSGSVLKLEEINSNGTSLGIISEITIPSDGNYEITFKRNNSLKYILTVEKINYFKISDEISFSEFSTEQALTQNYGSNAKAWVKLRFNNTAPSDASDVLTYTKQEGKQDCEECCAKSEQTITGLGEKIVYCLNDGNTNYSYRYSSVNPTAILVEKSIYTPAFDTVELLLNY